MGLYSKGTRSKGVTKAFQKQYQDNTVQRCKHQKRDAFLEKERFMKEAMAKHLVVATAAVASAMGTDEQSSIVVGTATANGKALDVVTHTSFPHLSQEQLAAASLLKKTKSKDHTPRPKLRSTMATVAGMHMPGAMRWEGKKPAPVLPAGEGETGNGGVGVGQAKKRTGDERHTGKTVDAEKVRIGHLMKPLTGDEIDFATTVDTNVKLPKYARGKQTVVKKRKKNKKRNARLKHCGE
tara:strand:+ start:2409 stop:3122 length:714 start_codon:yes stop_codon:yes gene_type:complete